MPTAEAAPATPPVTPATPPVLPPKDSKGKFSSVRESLGLKAKVPPAPPKVEDGKSPEPPATKTPKTPKVAPAPVIDADAIATAVEKGVQRGMTPAPAPKPEIKDETESLSPGLKRKYNTLERMAKNNAALAEKPKQFLDSIKKLNAYKAEWETANKGKKFNIEDEEHSDFIAGNDVDWDAEEFELAREQLIKEEARAESTKEFSGKFSQIEMQQRAEREQPKVIAHQATTAKVLFNEFGDEFKSVLDAAGNINTKEIQSLIEKNPILEDVFPLANRVEAVSGELYRIANGLTPINDKNPVHLEIMSFVGEKEAELKAKPPEEQKNADGKTFSTAVEWDAMSPEDRKKHWHFTDKDLSALFAFKQAKIAKKIIADAEARVEKIVKVRGLKPADAEKPASGGVAKPLVPPIDKPEEEKTPAGVIAPRMAAPENRSAGDKSVRAKLLGR